MQVGIIGGGQLARMLAFAGLPWGVEFKFLLSQDQDLRCVDGLGEIVRLSDDGNELKNFAKGLDVVTIESEQVDIDLLSQVSNYVTVNPNIEAVRMLQDRIFEKRLLDKLGIATADHFDFNSLDQLMEKSGQLKFPFVIKSARNGYDGKHQYRIKNSADLENLKNESLSGDYIAESFINFERELSFIAARNNSGEIKLYAPTENYHHDGILHRSIAPAPNVSKSVAKEGTQLLEKILQQLDYVGVLAVECFEVKQGTERKLLVNEIAPRVHNSGHWTQSGSCASQFENHVRAVLDLPLLSTESTGFTLMLNILGEQTFDVRQLPKNSVIHWYNKETKPGRKMGHINIHCESQESLERSLEELTGRQPQKNDHAKNSASNG